MRAHARTCGLFPWSRRVPYDWTLWFAWYPVETEQGRWRWLVYVEVKMQGAVAPNGDLCDITWYREAWWRR